MSIGENCEKCKIFPIEISKPLNTNNINKFSICKFSAL